jgi:cytochrome b561
VSRTLASRYQPVLVALHWLLALMIVGLLCLGFFVLADMPNSDPKKLDILVWHMSGGMFVLVLMIPRVIIRLRARVRRRRRPVRPCSTGWPRSRTPACM